MKILEVFRGKTELLELPIYKKFNTNPQKEQVLTSEDIFANDIIYIILPQDKIEIIVNKNGPLGIFTVEQFAEFYIAPSESLPQDEMNSIDELLATIFIKF